MTIDVLLFGPHARAAGAAAVRVVLGEDRSVAAALGCLAAQHPTLAPLLVGARLSVNASFAAPDTLVSPGDEVALIGMVGGG